MLWLFRRRNSQWLHIHFSHFLNEFFHFRLSLTNLVLDIFDLKHMVMLRLLYTRWRFMIAHKKQFVKLCLQSSQWKIFHFHDFFHKKNQNSNFMKQFKIFVKFCLLLIYKVQKFFHFHDFFKKHCRTLFILTNFFHRISKIPILTLSTTDAI